MSKAVWLSDTRTCLDLGGIDRVLLEKIEQRRVHALHQRRRRPQPQRDLLELPAPAEIGGRELRLPAVGVGVVEAAVLGGEELARRQELLLARAAPPSGRTARRGTDGTSPSAFPRPRTCRRPGCRRGRTPSPWSRRRSRAAGRPPPPRRTGRARRVRASRGRGTPDNRARCRSASSTSLPAAIATSRSRPELPSRSAIASAGGTTSGRDVGHGGAMRVAHGDGGDQIAVEQRRAGEREAVAADHARFRSIAPAPMPAPRPGRFPRPGGRRARRRARRAAGSCSAP